MASISIKECFNAQLPGITRPQLRYEKVTPSGTATQKMGAPTVLIHSPIEALEYIADEHLLHECIEKYRLHEKESCSNVPELMLNSEGDTSNLSGLYILMPILEVLRALFPGQWSFNREDSNTEMRKSSSSTAGTVRYDLVFRKAAVDGTRGGILAILEYKRPGLILYKDFRNALLREDSSPETIQYKISRNEATFLTENAETFTKQVATYAASSKCKHAALFDWDNLLIFKFDKMPDVRQEMMRLTVGREAKISWVCEDKLENDDKQDYRETGCIRKVLLGWLIQAFADAGITAEGKA